MEPGRLVGGKYRVERVIGQGGMALVVAAQHVELDELVALKILLPERASDTTVRERFAREARAAAKIKSEHVARVMDVGTTDDDTPYIVMEYLDGEDLAATLARRGKLPAPEAIHYVLHVCDALREAHSLGIIHRDVKPANLFLARSRGRPPSLKVLDFGISKVERLHDRRRTETKEILGSPWYMAPEQLKRAGSADPRSDLWSVGVILYELLTGEVPFDGETMTEVIVKVLQEPAALDGVPADLAPIVRRCLAKSPDDRYATMDDLAAALRALLDEQSLHPPDEAPPTTKEAPEPAPVTRPIGLKSAPPRPRPSSPPIGQLPASPPPWTSPIPRQSQPPPRPAKTEPPPPPPGDQARASDGAPPTPRIATAPPPAARPTPTPTPTPVRSEELARVEDVEMLDEDARESEPGEPVDESELLPSERPPPSAARAKEPDAKKAPAPRAVKEPPAPKIAEVTVPPATKAAPAAPHASGRSFGPIAAAAAVLLLVVYGAAKLAPSAPAASPVASAAAAPPPPPETAAVEPVAPVATAPSATPAPAPAVDEAPPPVAAAPDQDASPAAPVAVAAAAKQAPAEPRPKPAAPPPPTTIEDDDQAIAFAIQRRNYAAVKAACWDPNMGTAVVTVAASLGQDGSVAGAKASAADAQLAQCVEGQVRTWVFPSSTRPTRSVQIPIRFRR